MQAIIIDRYGGPEVLRLQRIQVPVPGPDEVLVQVERAGINFMDVHTRQGKYRHSRSYPVRLPCTLGMEGAGTVVETGSGVRRIRAGDRVAWCIVWGSYAEFACVPERMVVKLPEGISFDVAAAMLFQGSTAHYLAHDVGGLAPGSTCLVHAASGSVGRLLVQLARRLGARVIATASSEEKRHAVERLGADFVIDYEEGRFADRVREWTDGRGVDVVFDPIGQATLRHSLRAARKKGLVVNFGSVSGEVTDLRPIELGEAGSLRLIRPRLVDHLESAEVVQRRADDLFAAIGDGTLQLLIDPAGYCLSTVDQAHQALEDRSQLGKALLQIR